MIPASFLVRPAPQPAAPAAADGAGAPEVQWTVAQAFRTPQFITLALAHFACCAAHSGPIFHMVSYAMVCGIAPLTAVTVYSLAGFSGLGGRLLLGVLADRLGAKHVLVGGLFVQALSVATYLAVGQLGEFYALSVVFGLAYGGVMPLYAVLVREYFGARIMGTRVRRRLRLRQPRHGAGAVGRRMGVRHLPRLQLALCRLVCDRHSRGRGGIELPVGKAAVATVARPRARATAVKAD